eukprot:1662834-Rhodomonas_salina.1
MLAVVQPSGNAFARVGREGPRAEVGVRAVDDQGRDGDDGVKLVAVVLDGVQAGARGRDDEDVRVLGLVERPDAVAVEDARRAKTLGLRRALRLARVHPAAARERSGRASHGADMSSHLPGDLPFPVLEHRDHVAHIWLGLDVPQDCEADLLPNLPLLLKANHVLRLALQAGACEPCLARARERAS